MYTTLSGQNIHSDPDPLLVSLLEGNKVTAPGILYEVTHGMDAASVGPSYFV